MSETSTGELKMDLATAPEPIGTGAADENTHDTPVLKIDDGFRFLIPDLSQEESNQLEKNVLRDGCIDPIVIWAGHNIILDGHNRYRICNKNGIEFKTYPMDFASKEDAINWIIDNQLGRRNLTELQRSYLIGKRYNTEKKAAHRPEKGDQNDHVRTSERIAQESKIGPATVRRDAKFAAAVDRIKEDVGEDFGKKLLSKEIKLPKNDINKLAEKPIDEKKVLVDEILKGAKRLSQAEAALQTRNETQKEIFDKAGPEIEFAGWSWDPHKLDAPKNTPAPKEDCKVKQRLVYLSKDIFGEDFSEDETKKIIKVMRKSSRWIFMVHTSELERLAEIDWLKNVLIGCIADSSDNADYAIEAFTDNEHRIRNSIKFMILEVQANRRFWEDIQLFDWVIIRNPSEDQADWKLVVEMLEDISTHANNCDEDLHDVWTYLMPNLTVRPMEYPFE